MRRLIALLLLLFAVLGPHRAEAAPDPARVAQGRAQQETLPALAGRTQAARARIAAAEAWFSGQSALEEAFPDLADAPLLDPAWLTARLVALQATDASRAGARVAPLDPQLPARMVARVRAARDAALDAETQASALEQRLLLGLRAGLQRAPGLHAPALEARRAELAAARVALGTPDPASDDATSVSQRILALGVAEARLEQLQDATIRALTVPTDETLAAFAAADLAALELAEQGDQASDLAARLLLVDRLRRMEPLLTGAQADAVAQALMAEEMAVLESELADLAAQQAELESELAATELPELPDGVAVYESRVESAAGALREAKESPAPSADGPAALVEARKAVRAATLEVARLRLERARRDLNEARRIEELGLAAEAVTKADVDEAEAAAREATERAEAARRSAQEADRLVADALEAATALAVAQVQDGKRAQTVYETTRMNFETLLSEAQVAREKALELPPLARERPGALKQAWTDVNRIVSDIRSELIHRQEACATVERTESERIEALQTVPDDVRSQADRSLVEDLVKAESALEERRLSRIRSCRASLTALSNVQQEAKASRRRMEAVAPSAVGRTFESALVELFAEARALAVRGTAELWSITQLGPADLRISIRQVFDILLGSVELLFIFVIWLVSRRSTARMSRALVRAVTEARRSPLTQGLAGQLEGMGVRIAPQAWKDLEEALQPVLVSLIDVIGGALLFAVLTNRSALLAFPVLAWTALQVRALAPAAVHLALSMPSNTEVNRPAVPPELRKLAESSVQLFVSWWAARRVVTYLTLRILDADRITGLAVVAFGLGGLALAWVLLDRWYTPVLAALGRQEQVWWTTWLKGNDRSALARSPVALVALILLTERRLNRLVNNLIATRAGLAWVGAAIARQRLRDADETAVMPKLAPEGLRAIRDAKVAPQGAEVVLAPLLAEYERWCESEARGMVALVGEYGTGKTAALRRFSDALPGRYPVVRLQPPTRCHDAEVALAWLAESCGVTLPHDAPVEARARFLADELLRQEPQVFLVDQMERLLLRTVGGYRALRRVMNILHATSGRHLWVCAMHGPAWRFLRGLPQAVNLSLFRKTVVLRPIEAARLASWLEERTLQAGFETSYGPLLPDNTVDSERATARVRTAFWLLLAEECGGNPKVALEYWLGALREGDPGVAAVTRFSCPSVSDLESKPDRELFVLTALSIHESLTVADLAESLNLAPAIVRSTSRQLESLGILTEHRDSYRIALPWLPVVGRVLRDKQFLHGAQ